MNIIRYGGPMSRTRRVGSPIGYSGGAQPAPPVEAFISVWATTVELETITIPTQNDTFNAVVDWGDSSPPETITTYNGFSHQYDAIGEHTISITGTFPNIYFNNGGDKLKIKRVTNLGTVGWTRLNRAFWGCTNLTQFTAGSTDTSAVTTTQLAFYSCTGLTSLDVSSFDTSSVSNMAGMFHTCSGLTSLDVSSFDTSSATTMSEMFRSCTELTSLDVSSFDTSSVTTMGNMFNGCSALTSMIGVEDWDITGLNSTDDINNFLTVGKMTTPQYDNLLINWEAQASVIPAMTPSFGASILTLAGAADTAKQSLINTYGWTISDGVTP